MGERDVNVMKVRDGIRDVDKGPLDSGDVSSLERRDVEKSG